MTVTIKRKAAKVDVNQVEEAVQDCVAGIKTAETDKTCEVDGPGSKIAGLSFSSK